MTKFIPTSRQLSIPYPKEPRENERYRLEVLQKTKNNFALQKCFWVKCQRDPIFFVDTFCWTFDPRLPDPEIPFILYPRQIELFYTLDTLYNRSLTGEKINLVLDKPRAVGATFSVFAWILYKYLFSSFSARVGSRKEDYVDKAGETDTLFFKLDYMLSRIPSWLIGEGHERSRMMLSNGDNQISGESANPNFSRGGRKSVVLFDELAFWEWARASWESSGETTNFRIAMSTPPPEGKDSFYYKLLTGESGKIERFDFSWTDVPTRDEAWRQQAEETKSKEEYAREVLKSFEATTVGRVYAQSMRAAEIRSVEYDPSLPLMTSWDFGLDQVAIIWWQKDWKTNKVYIIDTYHNSDKTIDFFVPFITGTVSSGLYEYNDHELAMIARHKDWSKTVTHYGDPDVRKRSFVKNDQGIPTSTRSELQKSGIYIQCKNWDGRKWTDMRNRASLLMRRLVIDKDQEYFISALRSARFPDREGSNSTSAPQMPIHDWTSHFRSAFEYLADNEPEAVVVPSSNILESKFKEIQARKKVNIPSILNRKTRI